jgi:hypothetical protein
MRKLIITCGLLAFFLVNTFAQTSSTVTLFSKDGEKFWVIINGIKQNDAPQTNVQISGLTEPNYRFKVIFQDETIPSVDKMIYTKDYDGKYYTASYVVKKDRKGKFVVQISSVEEVQTASATQYSTPLSLEEKPATTTVTTPATTKPVEQTVTTQTTTVKQTTTANPDGGSVGIRVVDPVTGEEINMNMDMRIGETGVKTQTQNVTTTVTTTTTSTTDTKPKQTQPDPVVTTPAQPTHYVMPGYNGKIGCPWPMQEGDFSSAKNSVSKQSFEDTRLTVAKQILESNCMTCEQIKGMMGVFSFEDSRLEFAKFAYNYVYDPGNYYKLNDAFSFSSSIDELNTFLKSRK